MHTSHTRSIGTNVLLSNMYMLTGNGSNCYRHAQSTLSIPRCLSILVL